MTTSLRDQLMQLGFKTAEPPKAREHGPKDRSLEGKPHARGGERRSSGRDEKRANAKTADMRGKSGTRSQEEIDLAKAYALRQRVEREEQQRIERERQAEAARRRETRQKLHALLQTASLNLAAAELPRHFEHAGKIRRIYLDAEQLKAVNAGELAIIAAGGRFHLVGLEHAEQARALMPDCVALRVDPSSGDGGEDYADPRFAVPDDLVW